MLVNEALLKAHVYMHIHMYTIKLELDIRCEIEVIDIFQTVTLGFYLLYLFSHAMGKPLYYGYNQIHQEMDCGHVS